MRHFSLKDSCKLKTFIFSLFIIILEGLWKLISLRHCTKLISFISLSSESSSDDNYRSFKLSLDYFFSPVLSSVECDSFSIIFFFYMLLLKRWYFLINSEVCSWLMAVRSNLELLPSLCDSRDIWLSMAPLGEMN